MVLVLDYIFDNLIKCLYLIVFISYIYCCLRVYTFVPVTPLTNFVENWILVINFWGARLSKQRFDAPAIETENCHEVCQIKFKKALKKDTGVGQALDQVSHIILAAAAENALNQEDLPDAHFLNNDGINVFELGILVPLMDILFLNLDINLVLLWNFFEKNMVALINLQVVTHLERVESPQYPLLLNVLENQVLIPLGQALGKNSRFGNRKEIVWVEQIETFDASLPQVEDLVLENEGSAV